ncbi:MAG: 3-hydroxyacyl-CoA dehydrogenase/enoyl-CoA hydratase family protein [Balneolaceae bacterium]|nr:3-hydroxyacyl-CoA dehydrogenase/enoyl-CoA hydratase family protein [Balneolaceae bacterium]MBO6544894.1 3-hydroxyacyl-CoA dehydrogenase/enoyl-CoA hydratase family protein [Balneolaceae bacterium]MBO6646290.1 3-hydroxyacyl-CoA dehydrogenase/enoyl-CoA hydratase family protein [Balneolaceae bacterium]
MKKIRKVAVLGSGVMGSQIAAHCINAGLEVLLLDLKSDDPRHPNKIAEESIKKIQKLKPAPFGLTKFAERIEIGNFDDDLNRLKEVDWICEVIIERMDIKKKMMARLDELRAPRTIVSSNTSGLPIFEISSDCSKEFKEHFLGTHFFNPPRYMKLLEIIPTEFTSEKVISHISSFCERVLGKGVVLCKDTPNFIGNRIGVFSMASIMPYFFDGKFRVEEIDALTGTLTGYSKSATFRTGDIVGLDVMAHVSGNIHPLIPNDEMKDTFKLPDQFGKMIEAGKLGNKSGEGFYKKVQTEQGREFHVINPEKLEYEPQKTIDYEIIAEAKKIRDTGKRLKLLTFDDSDVGNFVWETQRDLLLYAANRIPEISDSIESVDRAMKWGFNWELGPFERWDALGVDSVVKKLSSEGKGIPNIVSDLKESGYDSFYADGKVFDPISKTMVDQTPNADGELTVAQVRKAKVPFFENDSAALLDMGDGIALFEFKTKNATLGFELVKSLENCLESVEKHFKALVISHDGDNFAYGANLMEAVQAVQSGKFEDVVAAVTNFQRTAVKLRYASFPVIAAPFGRTLGGGTEFVLYSDRVVAHHELYMGLVEVGVGLIPAGGGTTELLKRAMSKLEPEADPLPFIKEAFKTIGLAKVSDSAHKAKERGFLRDEDVIVMNRNLQLAIAKEEALSMLEAGYQPPAKEPIKVQGLKALSVMKTMLYVMSEARYATDYDRVVSGRVAHVLSGGDLSEPQEVPEDYLLKLEREAILDCFKDEGTHARIEHMLKTGKPLRN